MSDTLVLLALQLGAISDNRVTFLYNRDKRGIMSIFNDISRRILEGRYLLEGETPEQGMRRAAKAYSSTDAHAERLYQYALKGWMMFASPVLSNAGNKKGLPISCYTTEMQDDLYDIMNTLTEVATMSSRSGGVGLYAGNLRSDGTMTSRGNESTGMLPFIKCVDPLMVAFKQGRTRGGATAIYLDVSHPEIEEFISARKPTGGDPRRKFLDLHHAVNIPDKFMEAVIAGAGWELIDPHTKQIKNIVPARKLWEEILAARIERGEPYIHWIDEANRQMHPELQKRGLAINTSNLCVAPETLILTKEHGDVPIEWAAGKLVHVWNGKHWSPVIPKQTGRNQKLIRVSFSNGRYIDCTPYHKFYIDRRPNNSEDVEVIEAMRLAPGMQLEAYALPAIFAGHLFVQGPVVMGVEDLGRSDDTYCFKEPLRGRGTFNGIVTGNCSEIELATNQDRSGVCCLSSLNLLYYDDWKDTAIVEDMVEMLDNVITVFVQKVTECSIGDLDKEKPETLGDFISVAMLNGASKKSLPLMKAAFSAYRERSLGLGTMGWHSYLQLKSVPFESSVAVGMNRRIFAEIKGRAKAHSRYLATVRGEAPDLVGSGDRNANILAIAPNSTSSLICGQASPSIEPVAGHIMKQNTLSGTLYIKNPVLDALIQERVTDPEAAWREINRRKGSVQTLSFLDSWEKEVFKTAYEINQNWVVEHAIARQPYICQAQSVNLFFRPNADNVIDKSHVSAVHMKAWKGKLKTLYYCRTDTKPEDGEAFVLPTKQPSSDECMSCQA